MTEFAFHNSQQLNRFLKTQESELPFLHKSVVSVTHEQNIICSKTLICRQLFAGHVVGSRPMKGKENTSNDNYIFSPLSLKNRDEKIKKKLRPIFFFFLQVVVDVHKRVFSLLLETALHISWAINERSCDFLIIKHGCT